MQAKGDDTMAPYTAGHTSDASEFCEWFKYYDPEVPPHLTYPSIPPYRLLDETAEKTPASPCTNFFGKRLTYKEIKDRSDRFAASLLTLGVRKGDRVILLLPNSPQFLIAYYGILKAGAVIVPLNPLSAERELEFYLTDSGAETAITIPLFLNKLTSLRGKTPLKHIVYSRLADFLPFPLNLVQGFQEHRAHAEAWRLRSGGFQRIAQTTQPARLASRASSARGDGRADIQRRHHGRCQGHHALSL